MGYKAVFSSLGFNFYSDLKSRFLVFDKYPSLNDKLKNSVFFYECPNNTNTSFYLVIVSLKKKELEELRRYVWNKNDADLIFYYPENSKELIMYYAKYSPKTTNEDSILESFSTSLNDLEKIEKIKHWQFDSGVFWLNYHSFIDKHKYRGIDKDLISTLEALKRQLEMALKDLIPESNSRNEVVQALIDRTLYIKYLEDNHIINSHFYSHYFKDPTLDYQKLLENRSDRDLNKLFEKIHEIFNNSLFEKPTIDDKYLSPEVKQLLASSFNTNLATGQLNLFHFQFDILPIEFISYIYEVFLSEKQKANGIYYTPKKLAQLLVDEVINEDKIGPILDPSSGSGMFLIVAYQRLLEIAKEQGLEPENSIERIRFRIKLLSENIFGIEKELTAQRFTLFSLSLQIFKDIDPNEIKEFIAKELKQNKQVKIFSEYSFFKNIKHGNTLDIHEELFDNKRFLYLIGNPPFFEIPNTTNYKTEISFLNSYRVKLGKNKGKAARDIIGKSQISQCFFLKIKEWSHENSRFGFISNSSNFYNNFSEKFQKYFYSNYGIEKIYELSKVKSILFEKAKESVVGLIFTNNYKNNIIEYFSVELGLFSERPFELLVIQQDKVTKIEQNRLKEKELRLRDFLIGNEYDRTLIERIGDHPTIENFIAKKENRLFVHSGLRITGKDVIIKNEGIDEIEYEKNKKFLIEEYKQKLTRRNPTSTFNIPLLRKKQIKPYRNNGFDCYLEDDLTNLRRSGNIENYEGKRILWIREGKDIIAFYTNQKLFFDTSIYVTKLINENYYLVFVAILNSKLINYYINILLRKRIGSSHPKIGKEEFLKIPIPKNLDQSLVSHISLLSEKLSKGEEHFSDKENEINELIYDLYELSYWEKKRVEDYFLSKEKLDRKRNALNKYIATIQEFLGFYFKNSISIEETSADFNLKVVKICLNQNSEVPKAGKAKKYILNEIFEQNPNENFLASQEKIYGKDCVYIIKEAINKNWTETKAFEDGQDLLSHLIPQ